MNALAPEPRPLRSTQILSVVTVVSPNVPATVAASALCSMRAALQALEMPFEVVVVLNGVDATVMQHLRKLTQEVSDLLCYPMRYPVDSATAFLAGVESAVGDWVATFDLQADSHESLLELFAATTRDGADLGLGRAPRLHSRRAFPAQLVSRLYHRLFRAIHRFSLRHSAATLRLLSRRVVNDLLEHDAPLVAWDTVSAIRGYQQTVLAVPERAAAQAPLRDVVRARWRVLLGLNAVPLRLANALCGVSAFLAALYCLYVIATYAFRNDVVPGWTTMSLMFSSLFCLMSLVLGLLSEYLILLLDGAAKRPRYRTAEEFASRHQNRRSFLNVERD